MALTPEQIKEARAKYGVPEGGYAAQEKPSIKDELAAAWGRTAKIEQARSAAQSAEADAEEATSFGGMTKAALSRAAEFTGIPQTGKRIAAGVAPFVVPQDELAGTVQELVGGVDTKAPSKLSEGAEIAMDLPLISLGLSKSIAGALGKNLAKDASALRRPLMELLPKEVIDTLQTELKMPKIEAPNLTDTITEGALKVARGVQSIPEKIGQFAKDATTRRLTKMATEKPDEAKTAIVDLYKRAIVPGVKKKKKTITNVQNIENSVQRSVQKLAPKYEIQDLEDFAGAITEEKRSIFSKIDAGLQTAGEQGKRVDLSPIVNELDVLSATERAEFSPALKNAIARFRSILADEETGAKSVSPQGAQEIIADLNAELQSFFRGTTQGTNADVVVNQLVLNNLKKQVDELVGALDDGTFASLKREYADLKQMEDDVVHRAVFEAQKGDGLLDLTDVISAGDIAAGAYNPMFLAKGTAQYVTKEVLKSLNDKNELVRQMFVIGKNLKGSSVPK